MPTEEQHDLPLSHAEALMDVATGRIAYDRTELTLAPGTTSSLDRFILPAGLDILTVTLASDASELVPPPWVGEDVSKDPAFTATRLALEGLPTLPHLPITNEAVEALLDWLEGNSRTEAASPAAAPPPAHEGRTNAEPSQPHVRYAVFRNESPEPDDDSVVRLARSLAPRRSPGG